MYPKRLPNVQRDSLDIRLDCRYALLVVGVRNCNLEVPNLRVFVSTFAELRSFGSDVDIGR
jgi:hypothetical protein